MRPSCQKVIAKNSRVVKTVKPRVRYHCHDSRAMRIVFSTFCTGGSAVKLSIFSVIVSVNDLTELVILSPIALTVLLCESMDDCRELTFSTTADAMDVPMLLRSSVVAAVSCACLISVHSPEIVVSSSAIFLRKSSGEMSVSCDIIKGGKGYKLLPFFFFRRFIWRMKASSSGS